MKEIFVKQYIDLPFNEREVLRYANSKEVSNDVLLRCKEKALKEIKASLCYREIGRSEIDIFTSIAKESAFDKYFEGSNKAIVFACTLGYSFDRLLIKEEKKSITDSLIIQAIGAMKIEEMCDLFFKEIKEKYPSAKPRFSPGFGGLDLSAQKRIMEILDCQRKIGVSLNESLLMSPIKSVTAFIAL